MPETNPVAKAVERKISPRDRERLVEAVKAMEVQGAAFSFARERHEMLTELLKERYDLGPEDQIRYQDGAIIQPEKPEVKP